MLEAQILTKSASISVIDYNLQKDLIKKSLRLQKTYINDFFVWVFKEKLSVCN